MYLARIVVSGEAHHQAAGVGPWLTAEILQIGDMQPCLFHHLAIDGFFQCLASLHETSNQSVVVVAEIVGMHQQYLVTFAN